MSCGLMKSAMVVFERSELDDLPGGFCIERTGIFISQGRAELNLGMIFSKIKGIYQLQINYIHRQQPCYRFTGEKNNYFTTTSVEFKA